MHAVIPDGTHLSRTSNFIEASMTRSSSLSVLGYCCLFIVYSDNPKYNVSLFPRSNFQDILCFVKAKKKMFPYSSCFSADTWKDTLNLT